MAKNKKNKHKQKYAGYAQYTQPPMQPAGMAWNDEMPWGQQPVQQPWSDPASIYGMPPEGSQGMGMGMPPAGFPGQNPAPLFAGGSFKAPHGAGILGWLGNRQMEQFILGLLLGGAAAYVLGDPEKRARLIRMGMKLYTGVAGSFEEFKEQIADLKAEVAAEQGFDTDDDTDD